jgi:hypothetical protein
VRSGAEPLEGRQSPPRVLAGDLTVGCDQGACPLQSRDRRIKCHPQLIEQTRRFLERDVRRFVACELDARDCEKRNGLDGRTVRAVCDCQQA